MAMVTRTRRRSLSWSEILPVLTGPPESLERSFLKAVSAIASARREGRITDEQADVLMKEVSAATMEAKFSMMIQPVISRSLGVMVNRGKRWPNIVTPFSARR